MPHCAEPTALKSKISIWGRITIFKNTRQSSRQNVLGRIVLQSETGEPEDDVNKSSASSLSFRSIKRQLVRKGKRLTKTDTLLVLMAFSISTCFSYFMLMTDWYEEQILKELILENNSVMFDYWRVPPVKPLISIYVFNYTNPEGALTGREKPKVQEVGPYTFRETMERVNVRFYTNGTVGYQEKRSHEFVEDMSASMRDIIFTPNLPLLTAVALSKSSYLLSRIALSIILTSFDVKPFRKVTAYEFIWGSNDSFTNVASKTARLFDSRLPSGFGVLSSRIGISPDIVTIYSGATDVEKFGIIDRFNGRTEMNAWKSECDRLDGGDGTLYPPRSLRFKKTVFVYAKEFCRKMPLDFEKHVQTEDGFPAVRYRNPDNVFSSPTDNPINSCFCSDDECSPNGLQSIEPCSYGAPFFISLPHFLRGDSRLHRSVLGLSPNASRHASFIDIHKKLGIPVAGVSRLQMNVRLVKPSRFSPLAELDDGMFLPVAWIQCKIGKLPENLRSIVYHVTFSVTFLEYFLTFSSVFSSVYFFYSAIVKLCK